MQLIPTSLPGVMLVSQHVHRDDRGWFKETFRWQALRDGLLAHGQNVPEALVQENMSCSQKGVLRGLHWQSAPHAQAKLLQVLSGKTFSVAVDIRRGSPTFGRWVGVSMHPGQHQALWISEGHAHGFLAMEDNTVVLYKTTDCYHSKYEASVRWNSAHLRITWPDPGVPFVLSDKDRAALDWAELFSENS